MSNEQFRNFVKRAVAPRGQLALTHVTDYVNIPEVIESRCLAANDCPVLNERLLYLFYGRPAYRSRWEGGATSNLDYARVCFVLREDVLAKARRIFPFDSGGFERYRKAFHRDLKLADFVLAEGGHPLQIVGAFYGSLADYYWMNPTQSRRFKATETVARSYHRLITGGLQEQFDDRCAAIEVQLGEPLPLEGEVLAVIAPNSLFDDPDVLSLVKSWGAEPRGYRLAQMFNPPEISGRLIDEVARFLEERKWL